MSSAEPRAPGLWGRVGHACFDKDGTLTDVHRYWDHTSRLRAAALAGRFSLEPSQSEPLLECMGIDPGSRRIRPGGPVGFRPRPVVVEHILGHLVSRGVGASAEDIQEVLREVDRVQQERGDYRIELLPGVSEALAGLAERGVVLSLYSSDRRENSLQVLERLSLGGSFKAVVGGGCVRRPKPDPEGFLLACRQAGVPPERSVYIGDTVEDMRMCARAGGAAAVGVLTGLSGAEELRAVTPYVCADLSGLFPPGGLKP